MWIYQIVGVRKSSEHGSMTPHLCAFVFLRFMLTRGLGECLAVFWVPFFVGQGHRKSTERKFLIFGTAQ